LRPYNYYVLSHDPPVLCYLGAGIMNKAIGIPPLPDELRPVTLLEYPLSLQADLQQMERVALLQPQLEDQGIEHHFMVNTKIEDRWRIEHNVRGAYFSQNAFVNENIFAPTKATRLYDAIHIAGMYDVKRHELAQKIELLYVVTYNGKDLHTYRPELSHAQFNKTYLSHTRIAGLINSSGVGLCLSAIEGAMFASMEYLMCGTPVVTTPSKGGRDEFFNPKNSICVEPDPDAVKSGVNVWNNNSPDPHMIRSGVLRQVTCIRSGFTRYIARMINDKAGKDVLPEILMKRFYSSEGIAARALPMKQFTNSSCLLRFKFDLDSAIPSKIPGYSEHVRKHTLYLKSSAGLDMNMDSSGAIVWGLCDGVNCVSDIARLIADAYDVDVDSVRPHVNTTLGVLHQHKLIA
jgi:hypothetical protein